MGWTIRVSGLPEGYKIVEWEDGLSLLNPRGASIAEFGAMLVDLGVVLRAAWDDAGSSQGTELQPVR
jgi:hypothetical protein